MCVCVCRVATDLLAGVHEAQVQAASDQDHTVPDPHAKAEEEGTAEAGGREAQGGAGAEEEGAKGPHRGQGGARHRERASRPPHSGDDH